MPKRKYDEPAVPIQLDAHQLRVEVYRLLSENLFKPHPYSRQVGEVIDRIDGLLSTLEPSDEEHGRRSSDIDAAAAWIRNPGKGTRIALLGGLFASCNTDRASAVRDSRNALSVYAIVEGAHNLSLIIDDAVDRDHIRRGEPTIYSLGGRPLVRQVARIYVDLLFRLVSLLRTTTETKRSCCIHLTQTARRLRTVIEEEIASERGITQTEIAQLLERTRRLYVAKSFGLISLGIALLSELYVLDEQSVKRFTDFTADAGVFLQRVNDLENYSSVKACGSKNVDRFSDIRHRRVTLLLLTELHAGNSDLASLFRRVFGANPTEGRCQELAAFVLASGILETEMLRLGDERKRLLDSAERLCDRSPSAAATARSILDQYFQALDMYSFD